MRLLLCVFAMMAAICTASARDAYTGTLPSVPDSLRTVEDRARHIALHYWEDMPLTDDRTVEQQLVDFLVVLDLLPDSTDKATAVGAMLGRPQNADEQARLLRVIQEYIYDPDSPYDNPDLYATVIDTALATLTLTQVQRLRLEADRREIDLCHPGAAMPSLPLAGMHGEDFDFQGLCARGTVMLIVYDNGCEECMEGIARIRDNTDITAGIAAGALTVVAVDTGNSALSPALPPQWHRGRPTADLDDILVLRHRPSVYIITDGIITAKDITL